MLDAVFSALRDLQGHPPHRQPRHAGRLASAAAAIDLAAALLSGRVPASDRDPESVTLPARGRTV